MMQPKEPTIKQRVLILRPEIVRCVNELVVGRDDMPSVREITANTRKFGDYPDE
jgi:hypothetical protein